MDIRIRFLLFTILVISLSSIFIGNALPQAFAQDSEVHEFFEVAYSVFVTDVASQMEAESPQHIEKQFEIIPLDEIIRANYTNDPTVFLILLPLFGFIFVRSFDEEYNKTFQRLSCFTMIFILLGLGVAVPGMTGAAYWGTAFGQEVILSSDTSTETSSTEHTVTLEHDDIEINKPVNWTASVEFTNQQQTVAVEISFDSTITQILNSFDENITFSSVTDPPSLDTSIPIVQITDPQVLEEGAQTKLILIEQAVQTFQIEFETAAPYTEENEQSTED